MHASASRYHALQHALPRHGVDVRAQLACLCNNFARSRQFPGSYRTRWLGSSIDEEQEKLMALRDNDAVGQRHLNGALSSTLTLRK